jgi:2-amino-4-hydroxy-6-hydroxymethyldihydropteridine diphosphokinase
MSEVYLIIGGNQGDRESIFENTLMLISERVGTITNRSGIYESESWGFDSPSFWNQVFIVDTRLPPLELLNTVLDIETELGRKRDNPGKYCARVIDIDILFYNRDIIEEPNLIVPHPLISKRRFVLVPLAEVTPDYIHPVTNKTILQMLEVCKDKLDVKRVNSNY